MRSSTKVLPLTLAALALPVLGQYRIVHLLEPEAQRPSFGTSVSDAGDVNGDGTPDLIVGHPNRDNPDDSYSYPAGAAHVFSGVDGSLLYTFYGTSPEGQFGYAVSGAGDTNGDGFDDGSVTPCPCDNHDAAAGCANSSGQGALLGASGSSSLSADDLLLDLDSHLPGRAALLFAGVNQVNGGHGLPFGDGLRCVGGGVLRLGVKIADGAGRAQWGPGLSSGTDWMAGMSSYLQAWYRDPGASPCGSEFNTSNGMAVFFLP